MFCQYCGKEVEEDWNRCPYCGSALNEETEEAEMIEGPAERVMFQNRDELKEYLVSQAWSSEKRGVVTWYGGNSISKDLFPILNPGEIPENFCHAYRNSVIGFLKSTRFFRNYIVCTNQRFIFYERGSRIFKLIPLFKKVISISYQEITGMEAKKRIGIYSGAVEISTSAKRYKFAVMSFKAAGELKDFIMNR